MSGAWPAPARCTMVVVKSVSEVYWMSMPGLVLEVGERLLERRLLVATEGAEDGDLLVAAGVVARRAAAAAAAVVGLQAARHRQRPSPVPRPSAARRCLPYCHLISLSMGWAVRGGPPTGQRDRCSQCCTPLYSLAAAFVQVTGGSSRPAEGGCKRLHEVRTIVAHATSESSRDLGKRLRVSVPSARERGAAGDGRRGQHGGRRRAGGRLDRHRVARAARRAGRQPGDPRADPADRLGAVLRDLPRGQRALARHDRAGGDRGAAARRVVLQRDAREHGPGARARPTSTC